MTLTARERILETAGTLFMLRGYELVGVNEIIEKSDVAKATFYNHFKSKELLCYAWLQSVWHDSELNNAAISKADGDVLAKIKMKFQSLEDSLIQYSYRGCPFTNTKIMLPDSELISKLVIDYKHYSRQFWRELVTTNNKSEELGDALFLIFSGATTEAQNTQDLWPVQTGLNTSLALV